MKIILFLFAIFFAAQPVYAEEPCATPRQQQKEAMNKAIYNQAAAISSQAAANGSTIATKRISETFNNCALDKLKSIQETWDNIKSVSDILNGSTLKSLGSAALTKALDTAVSTACEKAMNKVQNTVASNFQAMTNRYNDVQTFTRSAANYTTTGGVSSAVNSGTTRIIESLFNSGSGVWP